ncbi:MAG: GNAT family N-acetyltransferase [Candidatus Melainabacteria bacterium]|nr:GNAT family N-acetyltransferase [Candidatus Melainabacteria bacterium]
MRFKIVYLADHGDFVSTCASWAFDTWGRYNPSYSLEKRIVSFTEHCRRDQIPLTVLALDERDKAIGMASLRANDGIRDDLTPWLGSVYVAPAYRSKGLGQALVEHIQSIASNLRYEKIYLLTYEESLPNWYQTFGWQEIGKDSSHGNAVTVMELERNKITLAP